MLICNPKFSLSVKLALFVVNIFSTFLIYTTELQSLKQCRNVKRLVMFSLTKFHPQHPYHVTSMLKFIHVPYYVLVYKCNLTVTISE